MLDGAFALAVPSAYGQSITVEAIDETKLIWASYDENNSVWYKNEFELNTENIKTVAKDALSKRLIEILKAAKHLNPKFLSDTKGFKVSTQLEFPKYWGLGTSSTLIYNISQWAQVDPFILLDATFGGSGYDIACAKHNLPITYKLQKQNDVIASREITEVNFNPIFKEQLYFVYLNKKQNSRDGIAHYTSVKQNLAIVLAKIDSITEAMISCTSLIEFQKLIETHEAIIAEVTQQETVKSKFFSGFKGAIKSLGAWGGDFILVASESDPSNYFKEKGFDTIINYDTMVK